MKNPLVWIVVVIILIAAGYFLTRNASMEQPAPVTDTPSAQAPKPQGDDSAAGDTSGGDAPVSAFTVRYTADGFSPASISVPVGTTVTFVNQSGGSMWVASAAHPTHTAYDGTSRTEHCAAGAAPSFDECGNGSTYAFTFDKAGTFGYHNHLSSNDQGTVVVTAK